jgi:hypothetical protein
MGRKTVPKGQVVLKKAEKLKVVGAALPSGASAEDFAAKFKELYPKDWDNIVSRYKAHERLTKPGKSHPMPEPNQYLLNMAKGFLKTK